MKTTIIIPPINYNKKNKPMIAICFLIYNKKIIIVENSSATRALSFMCNDCHLLLKTSSHIIVIIHLITYYHNHPLDHFFWIAKQNL